MVPLMIKYSFACGYKSKVYTPKDWKKFVNVHNSVRHQNQSLEITQVSLSTDILKMLMYQFSLRWSSQKQSINPC